MTAADTVDSDAPHLPTTVRPSVWPVRSAWTLLRPRPPFGSLLPPPTAHFSAKSRRFGPPSPSETPEALGLSSCGGISPDAQTGSSRSRRGPSDACRSSPPLAPTATPIVPDASRHRLDPADHGSHLLLFRFVLQRADRAVQLHEKPLFVLFRQLLPHLPPTRMAGQTLTQLPRHMKSIQLKARPLPKILPAGCDPRRRVAVDDQ
ncbi:hypothetical protein GS458_3322 [Geobacillus stearothermophilus]|nr:hypothetical protein GS458_3322 [Geobacillus stearothermophilus]